MSIGLRERADPSSGKAGRPDAEREVEASTQVAQRDDVGQSDKLGGVEVEAQRIEKLVAHVDRGAANRGGVFQDQLVDVGETRGVLVIGRRQQLFVGDSRAICEPRSMQNSQPTVVDAFSSASAR